MSICNEQKAKPTFQNWGTCSRELDHFEEKTEAWHRELQWDTQDKYLPLCYHRLGDIHKHTHMCMCIFFFFFFLEGVEITRSTRRNVTITETPLNNWEEMTLFFKIRILLSPLVGTWLHEFHIKYMYNFKSTHRTSLDWVGSLKPLEHLLAKIKLFQVH